ncbi:hypothetical protein DY218_27375 [Streptomyces triticagri]|uniref:Uncharacterized protein n=1 Tax=Streptomyces triticagri TaxID=2293568 RepID=A0A372LYC4_9ACTN|nr:hypothetical protein [Streptomyces triticagri]RFU83631.1 hypothetical protein DY218_27375 [Streptomyces triticagri]
MAAVVRNNSPAAIAERLRAAQEQGSDGAEQPEAAAGTVVQARRERHHAVQAGDIPEPVDVDEADAHGPLTAREHVELQRIHAARDNGTQADWMRDKALEAAVRRRLYRGEDGTRTVEEYLDEEWAGISLSEADRRMREWRMKRAVAQIWARPVADSHARAMLGVGLAKGWDQAAEDYAELRRFASTHQQRVTAQVVEDFAGRLLDDRMVSGAAATAALHEDTERRAITRGAPKDRPAVPSLTGADEVIDRESAAPAPSQPGDAGAVLAVGEPDEADVLRRYVADSRRAAAHMGIGLEELGALLQDAEVQMLLIRLHQERS